jgi:hypothetical protein
MTFEINYQIGDDMPAYTYRHKGQQSIKRFFTFVEEIYELPKLPSHILTFKIEGKANPVTAPAPEVVEALLSWVLIKHPTRLLYVLLQTFYALRPEEAYRALENLCSHHVEQPSVCRSGESDPWS